jgi:hypothetical protein
MVLEKNAESAMTYLIENSVISKTNFIPKAKDIYLHKKIIDLSFVKFINSDTKEPRYHLENPLPLIFGHVAYNFLRKNLDLSDVNTTDDLINLFDKFFEYFQSVDELKTGKLNVIVQARLYSLVYANYKYKENFSFITNFNSIDSLIERHGDIVQYIFEIIPHCLLNENEILILHDFFIKDQFFLSKFLASLNQYFDHNVHIVNPLFNKIPENNNYANLVSLLLSKQHSFGKSLEDLLTYSNPIIIAHALTLISYQNDDEISLALDYTVSSSLDPLIKSRVLSKILTIEWIPNDLKAKVVDLSKELILSCPNDSLPSILFSAFAYTYDPNLKTEIINELLDKSPDNFLRNISHVNNILNSNIAQDTLPSILIKIITKFQNEKDIIISLKPVIHRLNQENLSKIITLILNDNSHLVNNKISEILLVKINTKNIILSKEILEDLNFLDIKYIAIKSLGFINDPENLTSIIYSISQVLDKDNRLSSLIIHLFTTHILPVFRYPIIFLEQIAKTASEVEKELINKILHEDSIESSKLRDSLRVKELILPSWKYTSFKKMKFKKIGEDEKLLPPTPILDFATKVKIRAGRQFVFRTDESSYQRSVGMQQFTSSFEFPKLAIIDPVTYYKNINIYRQYQREEI